MTTSSVKKRARGSAKSRPSREDLAFRSSSANSVGVELELQVLDRDSGDSGAGSVRILQACGGEKLEGVTAELMQSMIEVKTGVCQNVAEVRESLFSQCCAA